MDSLEIYIAYYLPFFIPTQPSNIAIQTYFFNIKNISHIKQNDCYELMKQIMKEVVINLPRSLKAKYKYKASCSMKLQSVVNDFNIYMCISLYISKS